MGFFDPEHKTKAHIVEVVLILGAIGLTVTRMLMGDMPMTGADRMALAMGAKSLVIIAYQLLSEHVQKFKRIYSRKANLILNSLEVVFWGAVIYMGQMGTRAMCPFSKPMKTSCILGWTVIGLAAAIAVMSLYCAILSYIEIRHSKQTLGNHKFRNLSEEDLHPLEPIEPYSHQGYQSEPFGQYTPSQQRY